MGIPGLTLYHLKSHLQVHMEFLTPWHMHSMIMACCHHHKLTQIDAFFSQKYRLSKNLQSQANIGNAKNGMLHYMFLKAEEVSKIPNVQ